jgi:DNA sulfur modification protein DndB
MSDDYQLSFPAIRGIQAGREYYVAMCPVNVAVDIIKVSEDDVEVPDELKAQRSLNKARIPAIADYIVENPESYAFSSLTVSIDSNVRFNAFGEDGMKRKLGILKVPYGVTYLINDGQHRCAALEQALKEKPELKHETISLVLYVDQGLKRSQQLFADLNRYVVRPTPSISILFDHRDPMARLMMDVVGKVEVFKDLTEKTKTTISNRSRKLFTLSVLYQSTCDLLKKKKGSDVTDEEIEVAVKFWSEVCANINDWQLAARREVATSELRKDTIHAHGITLRALGRLGSSLLSITEKEWKTKLKGLKEVDWSRFNSEIWGGRATTSTGRISKTHSNIILTSNYLKSMIDIPLTPEEELVESEFKTRK